VPLRQVELPLEAMNANFREENRLRQRQLAPTRDVPRERRSPYQQRCTPFLALDARRDGEHTTPSVGELLVSTSSFGKDFTTRLGQGQITLAACHSVLSFSRCKSFVPAATRTIRS